MPRKAPAIAGPITRFEFMEIWASAMAFGINRCPTSSTVNAMRAGTNNEKATACEQDTTTSIQNRVASINSV